MKQVHHTEVRERHAWQHIDSAKRRNGITIWRRHEQSGGEIIFWKEKKFEIRSDTLELPPGLSI